ncbi:MAG: hypothetical protein P1V81_01760 [Planctomycetota bacterium]|nr:hypothetical protein [Planctomycetota bacterium]
MSTPNLLRVLLTLTLSLCLGVAASAAPHGTFFKPPPEIPPKVDPGPSAPAPPPPVIPGQPAGGGNQPATPGANPQTPVGLGVPGTPDSMSSVDLTHWSYWWYFNRESLLNMRVRLMASMAVTGGAPGGIRPQLLPSQGVVEQVVLPSLFKAIENASYDGVVSAAAIALGRSSSSQQRRIAEALDELVASRDPQVREAALLARGLLGELGGANLLIGVLEGSDAVKKQLGRKPDDRMRSFAAFGLALLAEESPIQEVRRMALLHLMRVLPDQRESRDLRVAVAVSMGSMTIPWGAPGAAASDDGALRGREDLVRVLLELQAEEKEDIVRAHVIVALGELFEDGGAPEGLRTEVVKTLIKALDKRVGPDVRTSVLMSLGHIGSAWGGEADELCRAFLAEQSLELRDFHGRHMALMAYAEVSSRSSGPAPPPAVTRHLFERAIVDRLADASEVETAWLCLAAAAYGARCQQRGIEITPGLRMALVTTISDRGSADRLSTAALALGLSGCTSTADELVSLLGRTGNPSVRGYTALSLGLMRHEESTDKLELLLHDNRYQAEALEHTAMGLALLNRSKANEELRSLLSSARSQTLAGGIAVAIGRISDPAATDYLAAYVASKDTSGVLRSFCTVALGLLADPRDLPWRVHLSEGVNYAAWSPSLFDVTGSGVLNIL